MKIYGNTTKKPGIYCLKYKGEIVYVGMAKNIQHRMMSHFAPGALESTIKSVVSEKGQCNRIKFIAMYGLMKQDLENFEIEILYLHKEGDSKYSLCEKEKEYIEKYTPIYNTIGVTKEYTFKEEDKEIVW